MKRRGVEVDVFNLNKIKAYSYAERNKNVIYEKDNFKVRIIELPPNGKMPQCDMATNVIFYVIKGLAQIKVNKKKETIEKGQVLITEPSTLSMKTKNGVKIMAIQIKRI